jgi:cytosine/adenosine deaminase-related metal-dependent hydrolase
VAPVIDPVAAVTLCADVSNVDTVIIGGKVHKRDGRLTADLSGPRALIEASKEHLMDALARRQAESA